MKFSVILFYLLLMGIKTYSQSDKENDGLRQNIIHVDTSGSDVSGDGSLLNPYATITKASKNVLPGDTVYVHGGTYHNENFGDGDIWKKGNLVWIKDCNGEPDKWITIKPAPGDSVLLETDINAVTIKTSSYIKFSGFEVKGVADSITLEEAQNAWGRYKDSLGVEHDLAQEMGIDITDPDLYGQVINKDVQVNTSKPTYYNNTGIVANKSHHIIIDNNIVRDFCSSAIRNQGGDYVIIKNNIVKENTYWTTAGVGAITVAEADVYPSGDTATGNKIIIQQNKVFNNANKLYSWNPSKNFVKFVIDEGSGIFLTRNSDTYDHGRILISNNLSYLNGASGIMVHYTDRVTVENNTVYYNGQYNKGSKSGGIGLNTTDDIVVRNNISWAGTEKSALYKVANPITNLVMENNIVWNENSTVYDAVEGLPTTGWKETNPMFNDTSNCDFRLKSGSPAIDSAENLCTESKYKDSYGNPRKLHYNFDIGAIEHGKYWIGEFDNDWDNSENWNDKSVVNDTSTVDIPSPSFYKNVVNISSNTIIKQMFVQDSAEIIVNSGAQLQIK